MVGSLPLPVRCLLPFLSIFQNAEPGIIDGGKTITVAVTDRCAGCAGMYDLDFSPAAYNQLADPAAGRINPVTWNWL